MRGIGNAYILFGLIWLVLGMAFGIWMGVAQKFDYANSHAHMNLVGFAISVLFGLIHRQYRGLGESRLAGAQFGIYQLGAVMLVAGKAMVDGGGGDGLVKAGSVVVLAGAVLFLWMFATRNGD